MTGALNVIPFGHQSSLFGRRRLCKHLLDTLRASESPVILDLTDRLTLDRQDIEALLACIVEAAGQDTPLIFAAGSQVIRIILEVTQISSVLPVFDSVQDAVSFSEVVHKACQ